MPSTLAPSPWKKYKRYSDNITVEARLITLSGERMMQVKESRGGTVVCPECKTLLSEYRGNELPDFILSPKIFHTRHKPLDDA